MLLEPQLHRNVLSLHIYVEILQYQMKYKVVVDANKMAYSMIQQFEMLTKTLKLGNQPDPQDYIMIKDVIYRFMNATCTNTSFIIEPNEQNTKSWLLQ